MSYNGSRIARETTQAHLLHSVTERDSHRGRKPIRSSSPPLTCLDILLFRPPETHNPTVVAGLERGRVRAVAPADAYADAAALAAAAPIDNTPSPDAVLRDLRAAAAEARSRLAVAESTASQLAALAADARRAANANVAKKHVAESDAAANIARLRVAAPQVAAALQNGQGAGAAVDAARAVAVAARVAANSAHAAGAGSNNANSNAGQLAQAKAQNAAVVVAAGGGGGAGAGAVKAEGRLESRTYLGTEAQKEAASKEAFAFNEYRSSQLSLHRPIADTRAARCRNINYPTQLPPTAVIICFVNEVSDRTGRERTGTERVAAGSGRMAIVPNRNLSYCSLS